MMKRRLSAGLAVLLILSLLLPTASAATLVTVETQFTYNVSNPAWLKMLDAREDMTNTQGTMTALTLTAKPEYPYSVTPEGFRTEVNYFTQLFTLDASASKAAYLYVLQYINQFASEATRNVSDEFIMEYLTDLGISYPQGGLGDQENLIFARALYTLLSTGAVNVTITPGMSVQAALIQCMTQVFNIDAATLAAWSIGSVDTIDEYVLIACKIALMTNGYSVSKETPEEEVYRLIAVMMIRQLGISIDAENADFDELKRKYLAALLGMQYDISLDPDLLQDALDRGDVPFYILQVMGRDANITIRSGMGYSEAFTAVAANTDYFSLEAGEFYADILHYETQLKYRRSRIWVCPQAYRTSTATETIMIEINNELVADRSYVECSLDPQQDSQDITITVTYQNPETTTSQTYTLTVFQGSEEPPENNAQSGTSSGDSLLNIIGNNLMGSASGALTVIGTELPSQITNVLTLMVPDMNASGSASSGAASSGSDYLSQLMFTASGGSGQFVASPSTGSGTTGGATTGTILPGQTSTAPTSSALSLTVAPGAEGVPMLLSQAGSPPEGYEYLTDANGYITGITAIKRHVSAPNIQSADLSESVRGSGVLWILLPMAAAAVVIAVVLGLRSREKKPKKQKSE